MVRSFSSRAPRMVLFALAALLELAFLGESAAQWIRTSGPNRGAVNCLAVGQSTLFAGTQGGVFATSDNGDHWTRLVQGLSDTTVRALLFSGTKLFAGTRGGVFVSADYGQSWTMAGFMMSSDVHALALKGTGLFAGVHGFGGILRSQDEGKNWSIVNNGLTNSYVNSLAVAGTRLLAGTQEGIFLSTDDGTNWSQVLPGVNVIALASSGSWVFAGTEGSGLYCSADSGTSWNAVPVPRFFVSSLAIVNQAILAGTEGGIYLSTDNGSTWASVSTGLLELNTTALAVCGEYLFAGSSKGSVSRRPLSEMITSVKRETGPTQTPCQFTLKQNYPNPFNEITVIRLQLSTRSPVSLEVLDSRGRKVATLLDGELPPGAHEVRFDAAGLPAGVYFYCLKAGPSTEVRKAVLVR
ncbi:MAG: T9SS type A sorting domain-containing protein [candidate division KSB1 bacterium]|nr:T9SS type A sorting domain-containing protein [candidate division KSB1 bacterium]